jgi:hypothetical protein
MEEQYNVAVKVKYALVGPHNIPVWDTHPEDFSLVIESDRSPTEIEEMVLEGVYDELIFEHIAALSPNAGVAEYPEVLEVNVTLLF